MARPHLQAWYRTTVDDGKLIAALPRASHTVQQVKSSGFAGAGSATVTGLTTAHTFTATGDLPNCTVNGTLTFPGPDCWDVQAFLDGVLWAYWPGINVGQASELDASGNDHHLTALTGTAITERTDGTGTNHANEVGFSIADGSHYIDDAGVTAIGAGWRIPALLDGSGCAAYSYTIADAVYESTIQDATYSLLYDPAPLWIPDGLMYTDPVSGDDGNDGTRSAPKLTLPAVGSGNTYALKGSTVLEQQIALTSSPDSAIVGYRGLATIDGAGDVTETWYQPDAGTYPNVWAIDVTHGFSLTSGRLMVWEDGAMLLRKTSIAGVNTTAGTYYSPNDNNFTIPTVILYIHATGSGNPNTNGKAYERTKRTYGIYGGYGTGLRCSVSKIITGRQGNNDGSLVLGKDSLIDRCVCYDGHKHNALQESGLCQNSAFINAQPETSYLHVFYSAVSTGLIASMTNCMFVGQENGLRGVGGIYCHDNSGLSYDLHTVRGCMLANVSDGVGSTAVEFDAKGVYIENCYRAIVSLTSPTSNMSHFMINDQISGGTQTGGAGDYAFTNFAVDIRNWYLFMQPHNVNSGNINLNQSTVRLASTASDSHWIVRVTYGAVVFSAQYNIFFIDNCKSSVTLLMTLPTGGVGTVNNNIYLVKNTTGGTGKSSLRWAINGVNKTFAEWQALGYDLNSIVLDETDILMADVFSGNIADGDFRLKSGLTIQLPDTTPIYALGVQESWDYAEQVAISGPPSRWPVMPKTKAQAEQFVLDPSGWEY